MFKQLTKISRRFKGVNNVDEIIESCKKSPHFPILVEKRKKGEIKDEDILVTAKTIDLFARDNAGKPLKSEPQLIAMAVVMSEMEGGLPKEALKRISELKIIEAPMAWRVAERLLNS